MADLSLDQAAMLTAGAAMWASHAVPEADIPAFTMSDGPMGIASGKVDERDIARLSPCATALGASWNVDLARRVGALVGQEAALRGMDAVLAPNLNLARSPLAGRAFEYFSEDPLLAGVLGAAWISGLQASGTAAVAKHMVCNDSETARDQVDVQVDERTLREVYLLPFEFAVAGGQRRADGGLQPGEWRLVLAAAPCADDHREGGMGLYRRDHVRLVRHPCHCADAGGGARSGNAGTGAVPWREGGGGCGGGRVVARAGAGCGGAGGAAGARGDGGEGCACARYAKSRPCWSRRRRRAWCCSRTRAHCCRSIRRGSASWR